MSLLPLDRSWQVRAGRGALAIPGDPEPGQLAVSQTQRFGGGHLMVSWPLCTARSVKPDDLPPPAPLLMQ